MKIHNQQIPFLLGALWLVASCTVLPTKDKHYTGPNEKNVYRLQFKPLTKSRYYYDITNETEMKLEFNDKKIKNTNKTDVGVIYTVGRDSSNSTLLDIRYDKIHLRTSNGDKETDLDAASLDSTDPVSRLLSVLKSTDIVATVSLTGELKVLRGYKEMSEKMLDMFNPSDINGKAAAQKQLDQLIGNGPIKKSMDQMFKIFPDSAVHIGDKWKLSSQPSEQFNVIVQSIYTLDDVSDGIANVSSDGDFSSDGTELLSSGSTSLGGSRETKANLKGKQHGSYEIDANSGIVLTSKMTVDIEGTIQTLGREIPIEIHTTLQLKGKRLN